MSKSLEIYRESDHKADLNPEQLDCSAGGLSR